MSIISFQCYELRNTADELDEMAKAYKSEHNVLSPMLRDAADTILELRNKLSGVVDQSEEVERLKAENAKLRELVRDMWFWHYEGHIDSESQERQMKHIDGVLDRMRELGVGVSE